jgi:predicted ATPase/DNA-binding SARP family transcriptional activator
MPGRLPAALTPLLGRTSELEETSRLLDGTRLLTLTGAGGSGKTSLALALAHAVRSRFDDGAAWVELAPLSDPDLIPQALLTALGLREGGDDILGTVLDTLHDRTLLLVLDNCEHLIDACAAAADTLLRHCAHVTILATTREPLGIGGEQTWLIPPLAEEDGVQLFAARARAVAPAFLLTDDNTSAVAAICRRLDGIPLAIELAAARVKVLSVEQIAGRLADAFALLASGSRTVPRHRTIRETIDWSYRLLTSGEQTLLRRLAVFGGTFSLASAEAVCGDEGPILGVLANLVDKSLVIALVRAQNASGDARYRLLDTVRQFAAEKLEAAGESARFRERHAQHFFERIEAAEPQLFGGATPVSWLDLEIDNVRSLFEWTGDAEFEQRLVCALRWHWYARGEFHEARRRIHAALARETPAPVRARALVAAGDAALWQGDWSALGPLAAEAVALLRESGDARAHATALTQLAASRAFVDEDHAAAQRAFDEAIATAVDDDVARAQALYWRGLAAAQAGEVAAAKGAFEESRRLGLTGHAAAALAQLALQSGDDAQAVRCFREAFDVLRPADDRWGLLHVVDGIALLLLGRGASENGGENGTRLLAAAAHAWTQLAARHVPDATFERARDAAIHSALAGERLRVVLASGAAMSWDAMMALTAAELGGAPAPAAGSASLHVRALGALEVRLGDEAIDLPARARELLLFLLTQPRGATKEQIGLALWPDAGAAQLRNNFHVTLHRLRKLLGGGDWIVIDDETYSLRREVVDFDADLFAREVAASLPDAESSSEAAARLARALDLYRGDFFERARAEWAHPTREHLRELCAHALATLGRARLRESDFPAAAQVYRRLLAIDPLDEQAARNLMTALARSGDLAGAARAYRRLSEALKRELGTEPDPATTRLLARLRSNG